MSSKRFASIARIQRSHRTGLRAALVGLVMLVAVIGGHAQRAAGFGVALQTGIDVAPGGTESDLALTRARGLGAQFIRLGVDWSDVAPTNPPPGFDPANPDDPSYHWREVDRVFAQAVAHGLTPYVAIRKAPSWGQLPQGSGQDSPDPAKLGVFAHAVASRYDGSHPGLPRIRYWEVWNEPNASYFLQPQIQENRIVSVDTYRAMVNDVADAVHSVRADNIVIAGALFPNGLRHPDVTAIAPLEFTRDLLCLSGGARPQRVCDTQVHADAWSVHPYTSGGPNTIPANPDNVWIENLKSLSTLVQAAQRLGTLVSGGPVQTWVTEFSWDSNPPDPKGVPTHLEQRWVAETLYRSWRAGINVFNWYSLRDEPLPGSSQQAGLYFQCSLGLYCDRPKAAAAAFRFPFVAYASSRRMVLIWGRTPGGNRAVVRIQWLQGRRWRGLATLRTDSDGIFTAHRLLAKQASRRSALLRAVLPGVAASPAFSLHRTPDIPVTPFGL